MAELFTLTTPVTPPTLSSYSVRYIGFDRDLPRIEVRLKGNNGEDFRHTYQSTTASALMNMLNTKNFTSTSMHSEILKRLKADGVLDGTVGGAPD